MCVRKLLVKPMLIANLPAYLKPPFIRDLTTSCESLRKANEKAQ